MVFKKFLLRCLAVSFVLVAACAATSIWLDEFGIFRDVSHRELRIYTSERLSKYLFSLHYIPAKFNGVLLGPSLSDIIDTREIKGAVIYNLSLTGGNASELRRLFENVARKGNLRVLVICVDPFITRKTGMEELDLNAGLFWSSLGSTSTFKFYRQKRRAEQGKAVPDMSKNSEWGRYHYMIFRGVDAREAVEHYAAVLRLKGPEEYHLDPVAFADLKGIVTLAREKNIRIMAYYHPYPEPVYREIREKYRAFQREVNPLFCRDDIVWDFNGGYREFRSNYDNYLDNVHLSDRGAAYIAGEIDRLLRERFHLAAGPGH